MHKSKALKRCRDIIKKYPDNIPILGEDSTFMRSVLMCHPKQAVKIGDGVLYIFIRTSPGFNSRGFWLKRVDGSETDFSFVKSIRGVNPLQELKAAMRRAISDEIYAFKLNSVLGLCPYEGIPLTWDNCVVDHEWPNTFDRLATDFLDGDKSMAITSADRQFGCKLCDERPWRLYHSKHARLKLISTKANSKIGKNDPHTKYPRKA